MKKFIWLLSIVVSVLGLTNCGGGSSEAKELLQKILQFVGIPQHFVVNVCQDANRDATCGVGELFTKVKINKGDNIDDIWAKISLTDDGRYFLQTYNPELPILVELQDVAKVNYDDGKFTLALNGFKTKEDDNETKEVSILESMVDANVLSKTVADKFRTLTNSKAQDNYYRVLFNSLETNINTLRRNELDKQTAMRATIKEMGEDSRDNQEIANRINACGNDESCIDTLLEILSKELLITDAEAEEIKRQSDNSNQNKIDLADYKPNKSMIKNYITKYKFKDEEEEKTAIEKEEITVKDNIISMVSTYSDDNDTDIDKTTINKNSITYESHGKNSMGSNRYVNIGDITLKDNNSYSRCILVEKLTTFSHGGYEYSGDIIKEECDFYGIYYNYYKKDLGLIAYISEDKDDSFDYYNSYYIME